MDFRASSNPEIVSDLATLPQEICSEYITNNSVASVFTVTFLFGTAVLQFLAAKSHSEENEKPFVVFMLVQY